MHPNILNLWMISFRTTFDESIIIRGSPNIRIDEALEEMLTFFISLMISTELQSIQILNLKYAWCGTIFSKTTPTGYDKIQQKVGTNFSKE